MHIDEFNVEHSVLHIGFVQKLVRYFQMAMVYVEKIMINQQFAPAAGEDTVDSTLYMYL